MRKDGESPLFKPGQIVYKMGDKRNFWMVPDEAYWRREYPDWCHIPYYARIGEDEFVQEKMRTQYDRMCIDCQTSAPIRDFLTNKIEACWAYVLVKVHPDTLQVLETIDTHVCEKCLRLARRQV